MKKLFLFLLPLLLTNLHAQTGYERYFTGSRTDAVVENVAFGVLLAGGGRDSDEAMRWFLERTAGGDVLVLRASGSDGYNDYLHSELGVDVNSVETIVFTGAAGADQAYVRERIERAEAVFFAGGDQSLYIRYWKDSPVQEALQAAIDARRIVIGGTSAGMAILGGNYYAPRNQGVTTEEATSDPFHRNMEGLSTEPFLRLPHLNNVITDTHFDQRGRRGRTVAFMARNGTAARPYGISCNERTAVAIDGNGLARVFGDLEFGPTFAYFLQPGCTDADFGPERLVAGEPLDWNRNGKAVSAFRVDGTRGGEKTFDLTDWAAPAEGFYFDWSVREGVETSVSPGTPPAACSPVSVNEPLGTNFRVGPVPTNEILNLRGLEARPRSIELLDYAGKKVADFPKDALNLKLTNIPAGLYFLRITTEENQSVTTKVILR